MGTSDSPALAVSAPAELFEFIAPELIAFFSYNGPSEDKSGSVFEIFVNQQTTFVCETPGRPVRLNSGRTALLHEGAYASKITDLEFGVVYEVSGNTITITYNGNERRHALDLLKIIRFLLERDLIRRGFVKRHLACLSTGSGAAIGFIGKKGAGKTSSILAGLKHWDTSLISNDKTMVSERQEVHGLPYLVPIRAETIARLPELQAAHDIKMNDKTYFANHSIVKKYSQSIVPAARLRALVIPRFACTGTIGTLKPLRVSNTKKGHFLQQHVRSFRDNLSPTWLEGFLNPNEEKKQNSDRLADLPWFALEGDLLCEATIQLLGKIDGLVT
ncbi:hypothetical protein ACQU0X_21250 [Pseudovibrio ascidiaceicola]|uniref:hypothetical protein n=1 Tax=Pseudovibrio ascidiaceicola TaxID=285279 RepID=UPI003D370106